MAERNYICLFDLAAYDKRAAPALRRYQNQFDPKDVVNLLREIAAELPALRKDPERQVPPPDECQHWIDAVAPDAGYKPSPDTVHELAGMIIQNLCIPHGLGFNPIQDLEEVTPWLSERSAWFADLMDGGEELAGGRLEFTFGSGALVATREQIRQFRNELERIGEPEGKAVSGYDNLKKLVAAADRNKDYTLLKTGVAAVADHP